MGARAKGTKPATFPSKTDVVSETKGSKVGEEASIVNILIYLQGGLTYES